MNAPGKMMVREHPPKVRRQAFRLYCQRENAESISNKTGVAITTIYKWASQEDWSQYRSQFHLDCEAEVLQLQAGFAGGLSGVLSASSKALTHINTRLDSGDAVDAASLASIASSIQKISDPLLRMIGK